MLTSPWPDEYRQPPRRLLESTRGLRDAYAAKSGTGLGAGGGAPSYPARAPGEGSRSTWRKIRSDLVLGRLRDHSGIVSHQPFTKEITMKKFASLIAAIVCFAIAATAYASPLIIWAFRNQSATTSSSASTAIITEDPTQWVGASMADGSSVVALAYCAATNGTSTKTWTKRGSFKVVSGVLTVLGQDLVGAASGDLAFVLGTITYDVTGTDQQFTVLAAGLSGSVDWGCHVDYTILSR